MTWVRRSYPALFALFPILEQVARNPGFFPIPDVVVVSVVVLLSVGVVQAIAYGGLRLRTTPHNQAADQAALLAFAWVVVFYLYVPLPLGAIKEWAAGHATATALIVLAAAGALILVYARRLYRHAPSAAGTCRFLTLTGSLLVIVSLARISLKKLESYRATRDSAFALEVTSAVPVRPAPQSRTGAAGTRSLGQQRDIYVIVLDEYAASEVYRERYGIDNTPFEDSLRALGFSIPHVRSNYATTLMSVASFLNFEHVKSLADAVGPGSRDFASAAYFIEHNRAERFLKSRGYRFIFFSSAWYTPTVHNSDADAQFNPYTRFSLTRAITRSQIAVYVIDRTLVTKVVPYLPKWGPMSPEHAALTFRGLADVPRDPHPTFALAHILMPHVPFIVDSACHPLPEEGSGGTMAGELTCLNRETLRTVREIIARSDPKPIIIIQGDHGSQSLKPFATLGVLPNTAQARERFRAFGAYYLPGGGAAAMPDSVSIVNVLRYVFNYYFNADLPPLPNTMYFSHHLRPYWLTEVDANFHVVPPSRLQARAR